MTVKKVTVPMPCVVLDEQAFLADPHARRYSDVVHDTRRLKFDDWLTFFSDPLRQQRLIDAEMHHQRPALAGVVVELEGHPAFKDVFAGKRDDTRRHRQTIGVIVKLVMAGLGWTTTGKKGFLGGGRAGGLSESFGKAEHYKKIP